MLVIAADDGPMPQSRERLDILSLTGLASGCVVITKADRVTDERLQQCREEIDRLLSTPSCKTARALSHQPKTQAALMPC